MNADQSFELNSGEIIAWVMLLALLAISWGLARASRAISTKRVYRRGRRERRLTDFASTILYFTFLLVGLILVGWLVVGPEIEAAPPPTPLTVVLAFLLMIACGVIGFFLEAGKRWAIGGVWAICGLAIAAFIMSMMATGIVQFLGLGLILLYACAIAASIALSRAHGSGADPVTHAKASSTPQQT